MIKRASRLIIPIAVVFILMLAGAAAVGAQAGPPLADGVWYTPGNWSTGVFTFTEVGTYAAQPVLAPPSNPTGAFHADCSATYEPTNSSYTPLQPVSALPCFSLMDGDDRLARLNYAVSAGVVPSRVHLVRAWVQNLDQAAVIMRVRGGGHGSRVEYSTWNNDQPQWLYLCTAIYDSAPAVNAWKNNVELTDVEIQPRDSNVDKWGRDFLVYRLEIYDVTDETECTMPDNLPPQEEEPPPPPPPIQDVTCYAAIDASGAVITTSTTITGVTGITGTVETVESTSNMLTNADFSTGSPVPDDWTFSSPLYAPSMYNGDNLRSDGIPEMTVEQDVYSLTTATYAVGGVLSYTSGSGNFAIRVGLDQFSYAPMAGTREVSSTFSTGGDRPVQLIFPSTEGGLYSAIIFDDAFLVPVLTDGFGNITGVDCPTAIDGSGQSTPVDPGPTGGYPVPEGTGGICYDCPQPVGGITMIGAWISYLYCSLANIVMCYVYAWILAGINGILWVGGLLVSGLNGIVLAMHAVMVSAVGSAQAIVDWSIGVFYAGRDGVGRGIDAVMDGLGNGIGAGIDMAGFVGGIGSTTKAILTALSAAVWAILDYIGTLWGSFSGILSAIGYVFFDVINAVAAVFGLHPISVDEFAADYTIESDMLTLMMMTMGTVDWAVGRLGMVSLVWMTVGAGGIMYGLRMLKEWQKILPN